VVAAIREDARVDDAQLAEIARRLDADGVAVIPDVLSRGEAADALAHLWAASDESSRRGIPPHIAGLDPNASNVRVFNLVDLDPLFAELVVHPVADAVVSRLLGDDYIVSNFTANIARPGSRSMQVHSDLSFVMPEPWTAPHTVNVIWCLTDVHADNGATLHLPGSHRITTRAGVPADVIERMVPFEATAGSLVVMEGRIWHTSGANVTADEDRALLFGYYSQPFLRPQWNFTAALSAEVQAAMSPLMRYRLGLDVMLTRPAALAGTSTTGPAAST